ncbi:MAG: PH domain-containing protein [Candidatus Micrarchaeota archaeon]
MERINTRIKYVWVTEIILALGVLWIVGAFLYLFLLPPGVQLVEGASNGYLIFSTLFGFSAVIFALFVLWTEIHTRTFEYAFTEKEVVVKRGFMSKIKIIIPYENVKDISIVKRGFGSLVGSIFGLFTIRIEGAKTVVEIPGFENPKDAIQDAWKRIRGGSGNLEGGSGKFETMLTQILSELKEIRVLLGETGRIAGSAVVKDTGEKLKIAKQKFRGEVI